MIFGLICLFDLDQLEPLLANTFLGVVSNMFLAKETFLVCRCQHLIVVTGAEFFRNEIIKIQRSVRGSVKGSALDRMFFCPLYAKPGSLIKAFFKAFYLCFSFKMRELDLECFEAPGCGIH